MREKKTRRWLSLLLTAAMLLSLIPGTALAATGQPPFAKGTLDSNSYRIPAMVTLNDGTIVAAADARWNTTYDGGGLDTAVAYSTNNGSSWTSYLANYLGDNGDTYNGSSSCFIDPCLATDGETVYMLCDLYPYGVALNGNKETTPSTAVGFNSDGKLLLSSDNHSSYGYYLDDGKIYSSSGTEVSGLTVDAYFNVTGTYNNEEYNTNLFFSGSPFKVVRTGYLYLTSSTDGGKTWSAPTLIPNVKTTSEQVCLVGPGRGLVTNVNNKQTIIFPVYSYNGSDSSQRMGFIYSQNDGATWTRVDSSVSWSSESAVVELADGTLRFFYRNGNATLRYVDYTWNASGTGGSWGSAVNTGIATNSNTQLSAIALTKTVNDQQVILVSCPTGPNGNGSDQSNGAYRTNGKMFAFTVGDGNAMTQVWSQNVTSGATGALSGSTYTEAQGFFAYSCLTALTDEDGNQTGEVALLYENNQYGWGSGDGYYYTMSYATCDLNNYLTFDEIVDENIYYDMVGEDGTGTEVTINFGTDWDVEVIEITENNNVPVLADKTYVAYDISVDNFTGPSATVTIPLNHNFADDAKLYAVYIDDSGEIAETIQGTRDTDADTFTFTVEHFSTYAVLAEDTPETAYTEDVTLTVGGSASYEVSTSEITSGPNSTIATAEIAANSTNTYKKVSEITSGKWYLLAVNTNRVLTTMSTSNAWGINGFATANQTVTDETISADLSSYLWQITETTGGYTIKNADGQYLAIDEDNPDVKSWGTNYPLKLQDEAYTFTIDLGIGAVGNTTLGAYLNNYGDANTCIAGYKGNSGTSYSEITFYEAQPEYSMTITAVSAGTTSVVVGDTTYKITVNRKTEDVKLSAGNSTTYTDAAASTAVSANASVATVSSSGNSLTITGVAVGTTTVTTDTTTYTVSVVEAVEGAGVITGSADITGTHDNATQTCPVGGQVITSMVLTAGISYDLDTSLNGASWQSADSSIATVDNDGLVTAVAVGTTTITVTGTDADGNAVYSTINVTVIAGPATTTTRTAAFYVDEITSSTVYCSINGSTDLFEINEGELIYGEFDAATGTSTDPATTTAFSFFAAPDDGYAVTYMNATNSLGNYYLLHTGDHATIGNNDSKYFYNTDARTGAGYWQAVGLGTNDRDNPNWDAIKAMVEAAIALGCDGGQGFTRRQAEGALCQGVSFQSEKLPELEKTITSITYTDTDGSVKTLTGNDLNGAAVKIGYTINYTINVYVPDAVNEDAGIKYKDITLEDELTVGSWNSVTSDDSDDTNDGFATITGAATSTVESFTYVNSAGKEVTYTGSTTVYSFTTSLTLSKGNFATVVKDGTITNTAELNYNYVAGYSTGTVDAVSNAVVDVTVDIPVYVVDFGLPVEINLSESTETAGSITGGTAQFGYVEPNTDGNGFIYTPFTVLRGEDLVTFTYQLNGDTTEYQYQVKIVPASNVLYEAEDFMTTAGNSFTAEWAKTSESSTTTATQSALNAACYGYDDAYLNSSANGMGAAWTVENMTSGEGSKYLVADFYGNGFDLIGTAGPDTGYVYLRLKNNDGNSSKAVVIDTSYNDNGVTLYQVPLAHVELVEGNYTATVFASYRAAGGGTSEASTYGAVSSGFAMDEGLFTILDMIDEDGFYPDEIEFVYFDANSPLAAMDSAVSTYAFSTYDIGDDEADTSAAVTRLPGTTVTIDGFRVYRSAHNAAYVEAEQDVKYVNVLEAAQELDDAIAYVEPNDLTGTVTVSNYESMGGPQSEIYLKSGKSIALKVSESGAWVQVSVRNVFGSSNAVLKFAGTTAIESTINHATEMYYMIQADENGLVTITNNGAADSLLAICNLKLSSASGTASETRLLSVSEADYSGVYSLLRMAHSSEEPEPDPEPETDPVFEPAQLDVKVKSTSVIRNKLVTVTITASTDVAKLTINGVEVWPANSLLVKLGWSDTYIYMFVDTVKKSETKEYVIVVYDANGVASESIIVQG